MKERPILFSAPMVRAILDGRKTQTRRICKGQRELSNIHDFQLDRCPYGKPGDRLWVREAFKQYNGIISYKADGNWISDFNDIDNFNPHENIKWKPSIHMPRIASRILLEITGVRVERLQDISEEDAIAEGVERWVIGDGFWRNYGLTRDQEEVGAPPMTSTIESYKSLWQSINGTGSWNLNPWVWVVEFKVLEVKK